VGAGILNWAIYYYNTPTSRRLPSTIWETIRHGPGAIYQKTLADELYQDRQT
jgi:hypothetical protein